MHSVVQFKITWLNDNPFVTATLQSLAHHWQVASIFLFYPCYSGSCSSELASADHPSVMFPRPSHRQTASHLYQVSAARCPTSFIQSSFPLELQSCGTTFATHIPTPLQSFPFQRQDQSSGSYVSVPPPSPL